MTGQIYITIKPLVVGGGGGWTAILCHASHSLNSSKNQRCLFYEFDLLSTLDCQKSFLTWFGKNNPKTVTLVCVCVCVCVWNRESKLPWCKSQWSKSTIYQKANFILNWFNKEWIVQKLLFMLKLLIPHNTYRPSSVKIPPIKNISINYYLMCPPLSSDHHNIEINNTDKPSLHTCLFTGVN